MNLYSSTQRYRTLEGYPLARYRFAEIELYLITRRILMEVERYDKAHAIGYLMQIIDPNEQLPLYDRDILRAKLMSLNDLTPDVNEIIVYLRFVGTGLNKVTTITKKQHYYQKDLLYDFNMSLLVPKFVYDWDWSRFNFLIDAIHQVATNFFDTSSPSFYHQMEIDFYKPSVRDFITGKVNMFGHNN